MEECQQIAKTVGWLGETWGFWIQTGAFFLSAIGAIAVIYYNGKQARLQALINLLTQQKTDVELIAATKLINELHAKNARWTDHMQEGCDERKAILKVLNNLEFIAVGVHMKAFHETSYKQMQYTNVLRVYKASKGFIEVLRHEKSVPTLYQDFERLAKRWEDDPIAKVSKPFWQFWK